MGASHSTDKDDKKYCLVDYGTWTPLGLYEENDECDLKLVRELISAKRLAPFYKGLSSPTQQCFHNEIITKDTRKLVKPKDYTAFIKKHEKTVFDNIYFNSVECPLCFLFYPGNINYARCCDQPICTECFVQLKKAPADSTKQMACPYCMTLDFGIIYQKPEAVTEKNIQIISTTSGHCQKKLTKRKTIESDNPDVVLIGMATPLFFFFFMRSTIY
ncbi:uncharacterized protein EV154DRAFT_26521 [Mucor mucedo]|uniref:uncharacterized protein n=1 Tax=Mucor mucedo TaxID=29922 RepID=UPI002220A098|nr:uncharacterized protein EV154DRAFT_26521 [Mucor mucedo]KAI7884731.1 hypothetical protein EV154DRAFT_26521 [Mucor mucedo]